MLSHAWAFPRMGLLLHAWIGSLTYAFSRMGFVANGSTFSRMDWLSHVCFLTHGLLHVWVYFFTHGLALSRMLSHAWAFSRMGLLFHACIGSLSYAFSRMGFFTYGSTFSRMDGLSHVCFLTHGLLHVWVYFSRLDWLSHVCFLTHGLFHVWVYFFTHGLALSCMLSHAWAFSRMIQALLHEQVGGATSFLLQILQDSVQINNIYPIQFRKKVSFIAIVLDSR